MNYLNSLFSSWSVLSDKLSKKLVKFVLKEALGKYLELDLSLDQINVELTSGKVHLTHVSLNIPACNEILASHGPFTLESGKISSLDIEIPWMDLLKGSCVLQIRGLDLHLKISSAFMDLSNSSNEPVDVSPSSSQYMSASIHIAQELFDHARAEHQDVDLIAALSDLEAQEELSGVGSIAKTIEGIANRFKVDLYDARVFISCEGVPFTLQLEFKELFLSDNPSVYEKQDGMLDKKLMIPELNLFYIASPVSFVSCTPLASPSASPSTPHHTKPRKEQVQTKILSIHQLHLPFQLHQSSTLDNINQFHAFLNMDSIHLYITNGILQECFSLILKIQLIFNTNVDLGKIEKKEPLPRPLPRQVVVERMPGDFHDLPTNPQSMSFHTLYNIDFKLGFIHCKLMHMHKENSYYTWTAKGMDGSYDFQTKSIKMKMDFMDFIFLDSTLDPLQKNILIETCLENCMALSMNLITQQMDLEFSFANVYLLNMDLWKDFINLLNVKKNDSAEFVSVRDTPSQSSQIHIKIKNVNLNLFKLGKHLVESKLEIQNVLVSQSTKQSGEWILSLNKMDYFIQSFDTPNWILIASGSTLQDSLLHVYSTSILDPTLSSSSSVDSKESQSHDPEWQDITPLDPTTPSYQDTKNKKKEDDCLQTLDITRIEIPSLEITMTREKYIALVYAFESPLDQDVPDVSDRIEHDGVDQTHEKNGFQFVISQVDILLESFTQEWNLKINEFNFSTIFSSKTTTFYQLGLNRLELHQVLPDSITLIDSFMNEQTHFQIKKDFDAELQSVEYGIDIRVYGFTFYPLYFEYLKSLYTLFDIPKDHKEPLVSTDSLISSFKWSLILSDCLIVTDSASVLNEFHINKSILTGNYIQGSPFFNMHTLIEEANVCFYDKKKPKPNKEDDEYFKLVQLSFIEMQSKLKLESNPLEYTVLFSL